MTDKLTKYCENCRHIVDDKCSKYDDISFVTRRNGCFFNKPGTVFQGGKKREGQQKQGRKMFTGIDITHDGLFPANWDGAIGANQKTRNYKGKKLHSTPGRDKPYGKATPLARYCAKKSRSYKHPDYISVCEYWRSIK